MSISSLPRFEDYTLGIEPSDERMETPEEYFVRLEEECGGRYEEQWTREREDAVCCEALLRLQELKKERRRLLWDLLKHPIASPSGAIGIGIGALAWAKIVHPIVAIVGEVVNAGIACGFIYKRVNALHHEEEKCRRVVAVYREMHGEGAVDLIEGGLNID